MRIIRADCRDRLGRDDIDFVVSVLGANDRESAVLVDLLSDAHARDTLLDDDRLVDALQDRPDCLTISTHLYFYLLVRHCLRRQDLDDRDVADYVARLLTAFASSDRVVRPLQDDRVVLDRITDMLAALPGLDAADRFRMRAHIGNYALFLAGIFPERIAERRDRRGLPGMDFYERLGGVNFTKASELHLAGEYDLHRVLRRLGEWFRGVRVGLNDLADRFLAMDGGDTKLLTV